VSPLKTSYEQEKQSKAKQERKGQQQFGNPAFHARIISSAAIFTTFSTIHLSFRPMAIRVQQELECRGNLMAWNFSELIHSSTGKF
jgi:hypothetical protein